MEHKLDPPEGSRNALVGLKVTLDQFDVESVEVVAVPGGEVVEDPNVVPSLEQSARKVRPDESRSSGYENLHRRESINGSRLDGRGDSLLQELVTDLA